MEFIKEFENNTNQYSKKIKDSIYLEKAKKIDVKGCEDICEVIIGANEIEYQTIGEVGKNKFITDNTLLNQIWIMDPKMKVSDVLKDIKVLDFTRYKVGEGI